LAANLPADAPVLSSDLLRCRQTADALRGDRPHLGHSEDLREIHFGEWEARTGTELADAHPELAEKFWSTPGDTALPGGESWNAMSDRVHRRVTARCHSHPDRDVIVVAHFGVILSQLQRATGMSARSATGFQISNLSVTRIDHLGGADWCIFGVNHIF
jgi:broad specificity phosphatase PhoE